MLQLWKARRGRKAAVALIGPLVEQSRTALGGIPEKAWCDPYLIGFLSMLVTLEAREEAGSLKSHALGLVQSEALADLTGQAAEVLGETIVLLSVDQDARFVTGCRAAVEFHSAIRRCGDGLLLSGVPCEDFQMNHPSGVGTEVRELWRAHFESRIACIS